MLNTDGATFDDITHLMTYPTMLMGVANLVFMPLALAVGRRPVFLGSCLILVLGGVLGAYTKDINMQLGVRMLLGVGAGNSEALVPMMCVTQARSTLDISADESIQDPRNPLPSREEHLFDVAVGDPDNNQCSFGPVCIAYCWSDRS